MHEHGGYCFVDFAASAPYVDIDMHPKNKAERLDAIEEVIKNAEAWSKDYSYSSSANEFYHHSENHEDDTADWFVL